MHQKLPKSPRGQTSRSWDVIWDRFRHRPSQRNFPATRQRDALSRGKVGTFFLAYILISSSTHPDLNERLIRGAPKRRGEVSEIDRDYCTSKSNLTCIRFLSQLSGQVIKSTYYLILCCSSASRSASDFEPSSWRIHEASITR